MDDVKLNSGSGQIVQSRSTPLLTVRDAADVGQLQHDNVTVYRRSTTNGTILGYIVIKCYLHQETTKGPSLTS